MKKQTLILTLLLVVVGVVIYFFTRDMSGIPNSLNDVRKNILEKESASSTPLTYKSQQISLRDGTWSGAVYGQESGWKIVCDRYEKS
jgi:hypothetical protein